MLRLINQTPSQKALFNIEKVNADSFDYRSVEDIGK